jgi:hypothetical protein
MILTGNKAEYRISSRVKPTGKDPGSPAESLMMITPTGTGLETISLDLIVNNTRMDLQRTEAPYGSIKYLRKEYQLTNLAQFDVAKGLQIEVSSLSGAIQVNDDTELKLVVSEIGTQKAVQGATITVSGPGIKASAKTDQNGIAYITVKPNADKAISILAEKTDYITGSTAIDIGTSTGRSDPVMFNSMKERTNEKRYEITGTVAEDIRVLSINKTKVDISQDRSFRHVVYLVEGMNTIIVEAEDNRSRITRKVICVELKTQGPSITLDQNIEEYKWIDVSTITLTGKVDTATQVTVNNLNANLEGQNWSIELPVDQGNNAVVLTAQDDLGNTTKKQWNVYVYHERKVECYIGESTANVDGNPVKMQQPPFVRDDRTFLDLKFIAAVFDFEFTWNPETKGISLTREDLRIEMAVDSSKAVVNGNVLTLDAPPVMNNGHVCIPIHFVSEIFDATVEWNQRIKLITIEFLV